MTRMLIIALLAAALGGAAASAQEPEPRTGEPTADEESSETAEELPEIDVWAEDAEDKEDVFVPTESISADASIAFPSDI